MGVILSSLSDLYPFSFELPFCKEVAVISVKAEDVRSMRTQVHSEGESLYATHREHDKQVKLADEAHRALAEARNRPKIVEVVTAELNTRTVKLEELKAKLRKMREKRESLEAELKSLEAHYAETQVFELIDKRAYSLTLETFANAIAGLPYIGWSRSRERCTKLPLGVAPDVFYCVFQAICYILKEASDPLAENDPLQLFEKGISTLPKVKSKEIRSNCKFAHKYMRQKWIYLTKALEVTWNSEFDPEELPYRITAAFSESLRHPITALERLLLDQESSAK